MRLRTVLVLLCIFAPSLALGAERVKVVDIAGVAIHGTTDLMRASSLDGVFARFGEQIATSPRLSGMSNIRFLRSWERLTRAAFSDADLDARLMEILARHVALEARQTVEGFANSELGHKLAVMEAEVRSIPAADQITSIAEGEIIYLSTPEDRQRRLDELITLSGVDLTFGLLTESLRGAAFGLNMRTRGEVDIPWTQINSSIDKQLVGLNDSLLEAARGTAALTYLSLSDEELDDYLVFLRTPAARLYYDAAAIAVGSIIRDTMHELSISMAARLRGVDI